MDNTEINFEDSFYSALSDDNKFYVMRNFKCTNVKTKNIGEGVECNFNTPMIKTEHIKTEEKKEIFESEKNDYDKYLLREEEFKLEESKINKEEKQVIKQDDNIFYEIESNFQKEKNIYKENIDKMDDEFVLLD